MLGIIYGLLCAASWAIGSISMRDLARKLDPFTLNAPRSAIGALSLILVASLTGRMTGYANIGASQWALLLGSLLVGGFLGDSVYVLSIARIGVSRAFPIASTYPALTLVLALLLYDQPLTWPLLIGMFLAMLGVTAISRGRAPTSEIPTPQAKTSGILFALVASVLWAVSTTMLEPGLRGLDEISAAAVRLPVLSVALWLVVAARGTWRDLKRLNRQEWITLIVGGLIGWGLGSLTFVLAVASVGSARAAVLTSTSPLFALPMSLLFLKEHSDWRVALGTGLTVVGIILVA
jgi:drug/metabolite transporter (DMT)-like permease